MTVAAPAFGLRSDARETLRPPPGRRIELTRRGTGFYRELPGPRGAPTLLLLHGWTASAGLNWFRCFEPLSRHFRVVAPDLRGHARGIRSRRRFRLSDCAEDVAALVDAIDAGPTIAVGYSMGGAVAQLLWRHHRDRVRGLVLCATSHSMLAGRGDRLVFTSAMSALAETTRVGRRSVGGGRTRRAPRRRGGRARPRTLARWAAAEFGRHDWRMLLEAGAELGRWNASDWIGEVDVPTAVVVTARDRLLGALPQLRLAAAVPGASLHPVQDGHMACARARFAPALVQACREVALRAG